jgi:hypothetical protein
VPRGGGERKKLSGPRIEAGAGIIIIGSDCTEELDMHVEGAASTVHSMPSDGASNGIEAALGPNRDPAGGEGNTHVASGSEDLGLVAMHDDEGETDGAEDDPS